MFSSITHYSQNSNLGYELHNLSFVFDVYRENNFKNSDIEENIGILNKIYYKPLMKGYQADIKKIYSPYVCFILVFILIPMFVYLKKTYIIPFCIIWGFILYITLIFGYYCPDIYYFPFVYNT